MRRSKEDAEQTRTTILAAAEELFARKGVDATSLEQIARAANVTRGAVYWHFKDKGDLLDALRAQYEPPQHAIVEAALADNHPDIFEVLLATGPAFLRDFANEPSRQRMYAIVNAALPENRGTADQDGMNMMMRLTTLAQDSGVLAKDITPEEAALYLCSFMKGLLTEWLLLDQRFDLVEVGSRLMARQIHSLRHSA